MGKGQKELQASATSRSTQADADANAARTAALNDPQLLARRARTAGRRKAIETGTIANQKDFLGNTANTAARERDREMKSNLTSTGVAGLASNYADPTQVALADKANKDEFARDSAAQTESDASNYIAQTQAMEDNDINTTVGTNMHIMDSSYGYANANMNTAAQIAASRASVLPSIIGAAIGGAAGLATQTSWFKAAGSVASAAGAGAHGSPDH